MDFFERVGIRPQLEPLHLHSIPLFSFPFVPITRIKLILLNVFFSYYWILNYLYNITEEWGVGALLRYVLLHSFKGSGIANRTRAP